MPSSRRKHPAAADAIPTTWTSYPKDAPLRSPFMAQAAREAQHRTQRTQHSHSRVSSSAARRVDNTHSSVPIVGVDSRTLQSRPSKRKHTRVSTLSASTRVRRDQTFLASGHIQFNFGDLSDSELFYNTFGLPRSYS